MASVSDPTTPDDLRSGGKRALARALTLIETGRDRAALDRLLDASAADPAGTVLGITGPPGVGKSTLTNALLAHWRADGKTVGVIAVDPSSKVSRGALLGDRTRIRTDPEDAGAFVRSMAARDRLGGLSAHTVAAMVLFRAVFDRTIIETVGIGQSEMDIGTSADTILMCIQPGSGDSLQFMKAGIMELPDIIAVTKTDQGRLAERARGDVAGALGLTAATRSDGSAMPVLGVSAATGDNIDGLVTAIDAHAAGFTADEIAERRRAQARHWVVGAVEDRFGAAGFQAARAAGLDADAGDRPFAATTDWLGRLAVSVAG